MPVFKETTLKVSFVCFFLMTGYKLFSLYYPLFLAKKGFSLPEVGWNFFLIYLPIAIFQPLVAFFFTQNKTIEFSSFWNFRICNLFLFNDFFRKKISFLFFSNLFGSISCSLLGFFKNYFNEKTF